jgi:vacuolar-type H+-ATPase subunit B/Vma2
LNILSTEIKGPLIIVDEITKASFDELVEMRHEGEIRLGRVLEVGNGKAVVQVLKDICLAITEQRPNSWEKLAMPYLMNY